MTEFNKNKSFSVAALIAAATALVFAITSSVYKQGHTIKQETPRNVNSYQKITPLIIKQLEIQQDQGYPKQEVRVTSSYAHVKLKVTSTPFYPETEDDSTGPVNAFGLQYLSDNASGVGVSQEGIHILCSGFYYIYSRVNVKTGGVNDAQGFVQKTLFHYVHRVRPPEKQMYSVVLLRSVHTLHLNNSLIEKFSSMGGVFLLTKGDVIQVRLTSQAKIELAEGSSYLGLFLIHSQI